MAVPRPACTAGLLRVTVDNQLRELSVASPVPQFEIVAMTVIRHRSNLEVVPVVLILPVFWPSQALYSLQTELFTGLASFDAKSSVARLSKWIESA